jgi:hypothetical protein
LLGQLPGPGLPRFGFQGRSRLLDLPQPVRPPAKFRGQLVAPSLRTVDPVLRPIRLLRLRQHPLDLDPKLRFRLEHPAVTHRLVLARVGLDLRPVQRHLTQAYRREEQTAQRRQVDPPELADHAVVRVLTACDHPKRHISPGCRFDPARGAIPHAVAVHQQRGEHPWRIRAGSPGVLLLVRVLDRPQVQRSHPHPE